MAKRGPKSPSIWTEERIEQEIEPMLTYAEISQKPLLEQFAVSRGFHASQITHDFVKRSQKFSQALKKFKNIQKVKWIDIALTTKNQAAAIFVLKNISDMADRQEIKHEGIPQNLTIVIPEGYKPREGNRLFNEVQSETSTD